MLNVKATITRLIAAKPKSLGANVKVVLDLSNYATKTDLKKYNRCWYIRFC